MKKAALPLLLLICLCLALAFAPRTPLFREVKGFLNPTKTYAAFSSRPHNTPVPSATPLPTGLIFPTSPPQLSDTPAPFDTPIPSDTPTTFPSPVVTAAWSYNSPGQVIAPILLYHHIASDGGDSRYYVTVEKFQQQMEALHAWGYTSITPSYLAQVLVYGGELPARPVIITFDDGNLDVYNNAFPIMQELGFVGTFYIVADRLGSYNLVDAEQLKEMAAAGWEIGSHSMNHLDLTSNHSLVSQEIEQSRSLLENYLGVPVLSFAYPFGLRDDYIVEMTKEYGYTSAMGLGAYNVHTLDTLYYLSRCEVYAGDDLAAFSALLPWTGSP